MATQVDDCECGAAGSGEGHEDWCSEYTIPEFGVSWREPSEYTPGDDLVQVLCRVLPDKPHEGIPRASNLGISTGDVPVGSLFVSMGFPDQAGDVESGWFVAGWNMAQDCWQDARCFEVLGWQPLALASDQ